MTIGKLPSKVAVEIEQRHCLTTIANLNHESISNLKITTGQNDTFLIINDSKCLRKQVINLRDDYEQPPPTT